MRRLEEDLSPVAIQTAEMLNETASAGEAAVTTMSEAAKVPVDFVENDVSAMDPPHEGNRMEGMEPPHKKAPSTKKESHTKPPKSHSKRRR